MDFVTIANALSQGNRLLQANNGNDMAHQGGESLLPNSQELPGVSTEPFFSPSAEKEVYLLATNFLLYVAMVIITTMIAKIYFPESLRRGEPGTRYTSYVRVEEEMPASYYSDAEGEAQTKLVIEEEEEEGTPTNNTAANRKRLESVDNFLEFDQSNFSKIQVVKRLVFCSLMLNVTFVTWGLLQERMLTRRYPRGTGEYFTFSYALVFFNRLWTLIMSGLLLLYMKPHRSKTTVIYEYAFPSISNMLSSWCQYEALRYVTFPATTIFKSFKLVPVMVMGKFLGNKDYPQYEYFVALIIGIGIALFMTSTDDLEFGLNIYHANSERWTGILLLCFFLFFDSFTGQWQSRMFQRHHDLSLVELLFATSTFSTVLSLITLIHQQEIGPAIDFVIRHFEIHGHFFLFSVCSAVGQLFIFYTIKNFGAVIFTMIMTARVLLSITLSCIIYGHKVTPTGFLGLSLVTGGILYRIKRKAEGTHLLKWQGMTHDKAAEMVSEWREHLDI